MCTIINGLVIPVELTLMFVFWFIGVEIEEMLTWLACMFCNEVVHLFSSD
jgi:hypothetical protein